MSMNQIQQLLFPIPYTIPEWVQVLDSVPETLGFVETSQLALIREQLVAAIRQGESGREIRKQLASDYIDLSNAIADRYTEEAHEKVVLAIDIVRAFIYLAGGDTDYFFEIMNEQVAPHIYEIQDLPSVAVASESMALEAFLSKCMRTIAGMTDDQAGEA